MPRPTSEAAQTAGYTKYKACLECTERHPGCHSDCETYNEYRKECERVAENRRKASAIYRKTEASERKAQDYLRGIGKEKAPWHR